MILLAPSDARNKVYPEDANSLRILTIGESTLRKDIPEANDRDISTALHEIGNLLVGDENPNKNYREKATPFFDRAFDLDPYQHINEIEELINMNPNRCKVVSDKILACGNISDDTLAQIGLHCTDAYPAIINNARYLSRGLHLSKNAIQDATAYHYRAIHLLLQKNHIAHMAMQYSTLPLDDLKSYFRNSHGAINPLFADTIFVGNQQNFAKALRRNRYNIIFSDRFRGSWGHTTEFGHELIAESVANTILDLIKNNFAYKNYEQPKSFANKLKAAPED